MKNLAFFMLFVLLAEVGFSYQVGVSNPTRFNAGQGEETPNAQNNKYRAFSNYNTRKWGQGVQTQTVQTQGVQTTPAGTSAVDFDKNTPTQLTGKIAAVATEAKPAATPAAPAPTKPSTAPVQAAAAAAAPAAAANPMGDPAAMMQQVQGMMQMVNGMAGGAGMPANMPDISAMMGGAPASAPAKK